MVNNSPALWPCPNHCERWCRSTNPHEPGPNHHPRCEHVDASLMDVWTVRIPGETTGCVHDNEADARAMAKDESGLEPLEVVAGKMHREAFESLGEFDGF